MNKFLAYFCIQLFINSFFIFQRVKIMSTGLGLSLYKFTRRPILFWPTVIVGGATYLFSVFVQVIRTKSFLGPHSTSSGRGRISH